eukprot:12290-Heterococcus_DN1.PRE.1
MCEHALRTSPATTTSSDTNSKQLRSEQYIVSAVAMARAYKTKQQQQQQQQKEDTQEAKALSAILQDIEVTQQQQTASSGGKTRPNICSKVLAGQSSAMCDHTAQCSATAG